MLSIFTEDDKLLKPGTRLLGVKNLTRQTAPPPPKKDQKNPKPNTIYFIVKRFLLAKRVVDTTKAVKEC